MTIIGDEIFAAAVDLRELEYDVDVRMNLNAKHVAHNLPDDVADKLRGLMRRLGLVTPGQRPLPTSKKAWAWMALTGRRPAEIFF